MPRAAICCSSSASTTRRVLHSSARSHARSAIRNAPFIAIAGGCVPARVMNVLSIQSEVVYGHVGNRAARFALERLGHSAWTVGRAPSCSPAMPDMRASKAKRWTLDLMGRLIDGLDGNGWLAGWRCGAVGLSRPRRSCGRGGRCGAAREDGQSTRDLLPRSRLRRCRPRLCEAGRGGGDGANTLAARRYCYAECV